MAAETGFIIYEGGVGRYEHSRAIHNIAMAFNKFPKESRGDVIGSAFGACAGLLVYGVLGGTLLDFETQGVSVEDGSVILIVLLGSAILGGAGGGLYNARRAKTRMSGRPGLALALSGIVGGVLAAPLAMIATVLWVGIALVILVMGQI